MNKYVLSPFSQLFSMKMIFIFKLIFKFVYPLLSRKRILNSLRFSSLFLERPLSAYCSYLSGAAPTLELYSLVLLRIPSFRFFFLAFLCSWHGGVSLALLFPIIFLCSTHLHVICLDLGNLNYLMWILKGLII